MGPQVWAIFPENAMRRSRAVIIGAFLALVIGITPVIDLAAPYKRALSI
jgi:hypothetical protein